MDLGADDNGKAIMALVIRDDFYSKKTAGKSPAISENAFKIASQTKTARSA
jgi:hypothetical protein